MAGDGLVGGIEQITLAGGKARQACIAGAVGAEPGTAGLTGEVQRLHARPPVGRLRSGLDQRQALIKGLEEIQVAVAFERAAVDDQQLQVEGLGLPEGGHVAYGDAGVDQRQAHECVGRLRGMAASPNLGDAALFVGAGADELVPLGPAELAPELVHWPDLQAGGAAAGHRVRQVLALADQRLERFPSRLAVSKSTTVKPASVIRYSSQWMGTCQRSAQSRTKHKVVSTSLPVLAKQTMVSVGNPLLVCSTHQSM
jgi:hypothetical protein